ncbi:MAG: hypothetical protein DWH74_00790, partial [Planctomycetota bacterium]
MVKPVLKPVLKRVVKREFARNFAHKFARKFAHKWARQCRHQRDEFRDEPSNALVSFVLLSFANPRAGGRSLSGRHSTAEGLGHGRRP